MMVIEFSMWPVDKGTSLSKYVARSMDIIDRSGLDYRMGPMGTSIEGEWDEVMAVIRKCWRAMSRDCGRITFTIKGDWREGARGRLSGKIASVERQLGRRLRT